MISINPFIINHE